MRSSVDGDAARVRGRVGRANDLLRPSPICCISADASSNSMWLMVPRSISTSGVPGCWTIFNRFKRTQSIKCTRGGRKCGKKSRPRCGKSPDAPQMSRSVVVCVEGGGSTLTSSRVGVLHKRAVEVLVWGDVVLPRWKLCCPRFYDVCCKVLAPSRKETFFLPHQRPPSFWHGSRSTTKKGKSMLTSRVGFDNACSWS